MIALLLIGAVIVGGLFALIVVLTVQHERSEHARYLESGRPNRG